MTEREVVPTTSDETFDVPLYTISEAARALDGPVTTFATWALGYVRQPSSRREVRGEPVVTALPVQGRLSRASAAV
jgi:hypothetical protein